MKKILNKIKQYNWVNIITYLALGFLTCLWVKYFILPLFFLLSGDVLD